MNLSSIFNGQQFFNDAGVVLSGGKINTYLAGSTTPAATYTDSTGTTPLANPIILGSNGRAPEIWVNQGSAYKFVLTDASNNVLATYDNVSGTGTFSGATVSTLSALRALPKNVFTNIFLSAISSQGVSAGGNYYYDASDTTSSDNGGTIIVANDGGRWKLIQDINSISVSQFQASGSLAGENAAPLFLAAFKAAGSRPVSAAIGRYRFDGVVNATGSGPITLLGEGPAAGPGVVLNTNCTQIIPNFSTIDVIYLSGTLEGSRFENFQINSNVGQRTSGAGIKLDATGLNSTVTNYRVRNLAFNNQYTCFETKQAGLGTFQDNYCQSWKYSAYLSAGDGVHEGESGFITQNYFFGDTTASTAQDSCIHVDNGYGRVFNNLLLGSSIAVRNYVQNFSNAAWEVIGNWIEEQDVSGVYVFQSNSQTATMYAVNDNEFSVATQGAAARPNFQSHITIPAGTPTNWATGFQIIRNRMRTCAAAAGGAFIEVQGGAFTQVEQNNLQGLSGNTTVGIRFGNSTNVTQTQCFDNLITGTFGTRYSINNTNVAFRDFGSNLTAAEITALSVKDGSTAWCTDGCPGSNPLQGSGAGCIAIREGGTWKGLRPQTALNRTLNTTYTVVDTDGSISFAGGANTTVTLPDPTKYIGREIKVKVEGAISLTSASSNVKPLTSNTAGTAILAASAGKWALLVSDGAAWVIEMAN